MKSKTYKELGFKTKEFEVSVPIIDIEEFEKKHKKKINRRLIENIIVNYMKISMYQRKELDTLYESALIQELLMSVK